jgi:hypothetical protein
MLTGSPLLPIEGTSIKASHLQLWGSESVSHKSVFFYSWSSNPWKTYLKTELKEREATRTW